MFAHRTTLDQFPISQFIGSGYVIDCSDLVEGEIIGIEYITKNQTKADNAEYILFYTGWSRYWGTEEYFGNYPYIDDDVAQYLMDANKKGVGLDVIGLDPIHDENLTLHKKLLAENEIVIIENLKDLDLVVDCDFTFCAFPLKHINADGSPIRAVAIIND